MPSGEQHKLVQLFPTGTPSRQRLRVCCSSETWGEIALSKLTYMDYLSCPTKYIKQHQEVAIVVFLLEVFDVDTSQLWLSGATVRPRQRGRRGIDASGGPPGGHYLQQMFSPSLLFFFVFSMVFSGFSQNHSNCIIDCSNPDQDQNVWYEKGLHIRKSQRAQKKAHSLSIPPKCLLCSWLFLVI